MSIPRLFACLFLLLLAGCATAHRERRASVMLHEPAVAAQREVVTPNGTPIAIPPPALWPRAALQTPAYRAWSQTGNDTSLEYVDPDTGERYVGRFMFVFQFADDPTRTRYAGLAAVTRFRKDGSRDVETAFVPGGDPSHWTAYDTQGVTPVITVHQSSTAGQPRRIERITVDETHTYRITPQGEAIPE